MKSGVCVGSGEKYHSILIEEVEAEEAGVASGMLDSQGRQDEVSRRVT